MFKKFSALFVALALLACVPFVQPARALDFSIDGNFIGSCGTATASGGAATITNKCGVITSEALTTGLNSDYTLTLTDTSIAAADIMFASVQLGTATTGRPAISRVTPGDGSAVIVVTNTGTQVLNGTIVVKFWNFKP